MENALKKALNTVTLKRTGFKASGCLNEGEGILTDHGPIFLKKNNYREGKAMFESEYKSLDALHKTNTVRVPKPIKVFEGDDDGVNYFAMELIKMTRLSKHSATLGEQLADLHLHNENVAKHGNSELPYADKFGFESPTYVGRLVVDNTWMDDWPTFFTRTRLESQMTRLEKKFGDREALELWSKLRLMIPKFFENVEIKPSLIHGDLWGGNALETENEPVIYDPGCVYAHHEFDIAMTRMFGGFGPAFYDAYYKKIPKTPGYEPRQKLYMLFHYLNHWNHFGDSYRSSSIGIMKELLNTKIHSDK